jgi:hypothetical protein
MKTEEMQEWKNANFQDFWAEIAPQDHVVQVYENEKVFLNTLEGFVGSGLLTGDTVIVICRRKNLDKLRIRLERQDMDINSLIAARKYLPLEAKEVLSTFMVNDWPDEKLFFQTLNNMFRKVTESRSRIRAFGEMVSVLWEEGKYAATVHLEHLWNKFCETQQLCLYCAYPKSGFTRDPAESMKHICDTHSKIIAGWDHPSTEINYRLSR